MKTQNQTSLLFNIPTSKTGREFAVFMTGFLLSFCLCIVSLRISQQAQYTQTFPPPLAVSDSLQSVDVTYTIKNKKVSPYSNNSARFDYFEHRFKSVQLKLDKTVCLRKGRTLCKVCGIAMLPNNQQGLPTENEDSYRFYIVVPCLFESFFDRHYNQKQPNTPRPNSNPTKQPLLKI